MILVKNKYGKGALNAIKTGFENIGEGAALATMADLSDEISQVDKMFEKISEGNDIVYGFRYMKGGKQIGGPWLKKLLSIVAGISLHFITGTPTHDVASSFRMYSKKVLNGIRIESNSGFELVGMEIVIKAYFSGYKVTEVPCVWVDRQKGESRFKIVGWIPNYLKWYFFPLRKYVLP